MKTVFIDGSAGTTGLRIHERLSAREDIRLLTIPEAQDRGTVPMSLSQIARECIKSE